MMEQAKELLIIPVDYDPKLDIRETEIAIKRIKDFFEGRLAEMLNLTRVSAPLFVRPETGINDNLNGVERPVSFEVKGIDNKEVEVVHSLAKWKRMALHRYGFKLGEGIYTDMDAIRRDEDLDNLHSIYVDQWDWERVISKEERRIETLKSTVESIYGVFKDTENYLFQFYPHLGKMLPEEITFITAQELEDRYPTLSPKERENAITKEKKAVFIIAIGGDMKSGEKHDGRAPDYDDWNLNGDILFWYPMLDQAVELSSMGVRVDEEAMARQLSLAKCEDRQSLVFHQGILTKVLPYTIGGGIGQSRICMFFLKKAHIGEVQAAIWPDKMIETCEKAKIALL
ncbi:Aspartate--ammonia ligase [Alkaliphilus metalliredigens QYMF]|uniref:Aspartate--ammonia ligase n=1 Tax=Alkaliphilus metalliredigens (strain QYMF) TaxID=293826 RepID=A6TX12_ALKMQ|nr:aspartate--ammonia ligase [Alkaliphilus metalliredigens]ABR50730.1 Aspartate--ammonia ligase [Alkaliphilus metalliredigens QYMF]